MIAKHDPQTIARNLYAMGVRDVEKTRENYRYSAHVFSGYAKKAAAAKRGKFRGYTEEDALRHAERSMRDADLIADELAKLIAGAA